jgi:hypothetical protein
MAKKNLALAPVEAPETVTTPAPEATSEVTNPHEEQANTTFDKASIKKSLRALGTTAANGRVSRTAAARLLVSGASEGVITVADTEEMVAAFSAGFSKNPDAKLEEKVDKTKADAVQLSKFRGFIRFGELPPAAFNGDDAINVFDHISDLFKDMEGGDVKLKGGRFDMILMAATNWTAANTPKKKGDKVTYKVLSDDEVKALWVKDEAEKKDDWQKLAAFVKNMTNLEKITGSQAPSAIIEGAETIGTAFASVIGDLKTLIKEAGQGHLLIEPKAEAKKEKAIALLTQDDKARLMAEWAAEAAKG